MPSWICAALQIVPHVVDELILGEPACARRDLATSALYWPSSWKAGSARTAARQLGLR